MFQYPSRNSIRKVHSPSLFLSGLADTLIPPRMMQALYNVSKIQVITNDILLCVVQGKKYVV